MNNRVYSQEDISRMVLPLLKKYRAEEAILFGSYARQEADAASDIDLVIIGGASFDPTDVFSLAEDLHRLAEKPVDVYELQELNAGTELYRTVFSEGVRLA